MARVLLALTCAALSVGCGRTDWYGSASGGGGHSGGETGTLPSCVLPEPGDDWREQAIDEVSMFGSVSLAHGATGLHAVYGRDLTLAHAALGQDGWSITVVDDSPNTGSGPAAGLDAAGSLYAVYVDATPPWHVGYARTAEAGAWIVEEPIVETAFSPALAVGPDGTAHLAYQRSPEQTIVYGRRPPGADAWTLEDAFEITGHGADVEIALGPDGAVHLLYTPFWNTMDLVHSTRAEGAAQWRTELLYDGVPNGLDAAFAVDGAGGVHIAHRYGDSGAEIWQLRYHVGGAGQWRSELVADGVTVGCVAIALDSTARPHVIYTTWEDGPLLYATRDDGGAWRSAAISEHDSSTHACAVTVDADDVVHAAYYSDGAGSIRHVWRPACAPS